jgi:hypothetical protein
MKRPSTKWVDTSRERRECREDREQVDPLAPDSRWRDRPSDPVNRDRYELPTASRHPGHVDDGVAVLRNRYHLDPQRCSVRRHLLFEPFRFL